VTRSLLSCPIFTVWMFVRFINVGNQSINQSLLRQKAAHAETHNKNKHKRQTKFTAMK